MSTASSSGTSAVDEVEQQGAVAQALALGFDGSGPARREQRGQEAHQQVARIGRLELLHPARHRHARLLLGQARGDLGIDQRPADDVDEIEERQEEAGEHRRGVELDHRLPGDGGIDDDHHRGRDQDAERAAGGDDAGGELDVVAGAQHRVEGDDAHQHHDRADQAAGDAPEGADDQGRHRERRRHAAEGELDRVEHLVDQRAALHDVAHQHEQRDRDQHVVGHGAVGALDHQVEDLVVRPRLAGIVEGDEAEDDAQPHQGEGGREPHHDHDHDQGQHQQAECGIAHILSVSAHPALPCRLVDVLHIGDGELARFVIDVLAVGKLLLDHVDLGHVLQPRRPDAGLEAGDAAHDLGDALQEDQGAGDRDHGLEMVDRRAVGGDVGMLGDAPGVAGIVDAGIDQGGDAGKEEDEVEHQVERRLGARAHRAVEEVAAHMGVLRQRVGAAQHEQRAVQHVVEVEDPRRRRVHDVALEDFEADDAHQQDDEPRRGLADPRADAVDRVQETFNCHWGGSMAGEARSVSRFEKDARPESRARQHSS